MKLNIQNENTDILEQTIKLRYSFVIFIIICQNGWGSGHQCLAGKSQVLGVTPQFYRCTGADQSADRHLPRLPARPDREDEATAQSPGLGSGHRNSSKVAYLLNCYTH